MSLKFYTCSPIWPSLCQFSLLENGHDTCFNESEIFIENILWKWKCITKINHYLYSPIVLSVKYLPLNTLRKRLHYKIFFLFKPNTKFSHLLFEKWEIKKSNLFSWSTLINRTSHSKGVPLCMIFSVNNR